ncbi:lipase family protein [Microbulbifer agarilyticus]|uniref:lipase family protein n=1 Tax=Microbulbifer agarilyticus TaxID=260552 RepID=UPI001C97947C|nr:lipase family protein [Microbulbifer agarilyticus]MBY6211729.1 lipase family protein [Microbulbifer agarilyticus]MCA0893246.1 lipase family protein [Microbulbifer agarilyticus]
MAQLTPELSANIANDIYLITNQNTRKLFFDLYADQFAFKDDANLQGKTGAFILLKKEQSLGLAATGIKQRKGEALIALKGTSNGYDGLTDLNAGLKQFNTGGFVHQGFYYAFQSFLPELDQFLANLPPDIHTVHCVGHSLGGALATLAADYLKAKSGCAVNLYTFGSPRVGLSLFSDGALRRLGEKNIFRVYHRTDPVPMVPTWPFIHVPNGGLGDLLLNSSVALNPIEYHKMENYIGSLSGSEVKHSWELVRKKRPPAPITRSIESWLKSDGPLSLTLNTAWVAAEAVMWVLKKVVELTGIALVVGGGTTFTLLDQMAIFLKKAYDFGKKVSYWVTRLLVRLGKLIGITVSESVNITAALIRGIFIRMHSAVSELVMRAGRNVEH